MLYAVFENRVLRWIFGPKRDEATTEWRKLHDGELNDMYATPNIIRVVIKPRRMRWTGHVACNGKGGGGAGGKHTWFWWGKPAGNIPLGKLRRRWEDNIKTDVQEVG